MPPRLGCYKEPPPTLGFGQEIVVGRFRCVSQRSGVTCTLTRSGRGFTINKNRVRRIGA